jgi:hypothetical protein
MTLHQRHYRSPLTPLMLVIQRLHREQSNAFADICDMTSIPRDPARALFAALVEQGYATDEGAVGSSSRHSAWLLPSRNRSRPPTTRAGTLSPTLAERPAQGAARSCLDAVSLNRRSTDPHPRRPA